MVKLADIAQINPRCPKDIDESQKVSFIAMASASEDGYLLSEEIRVLSETRKGFTYFEKGDVLLAKITPCFENGKCLRPNQIVNDVGFGSTEFHVLRVNESILDSSYLFYMVWSDLFRFLGECSMSGAAGQKRISTDFIKKFEIPLPPIAEQKRIAAILDKADAIRRKRKQVIKLADDFLRCVFLDMFGDPISNPKGWEVKKLGEMIVKGPTNGLYKPASDYGRGTRILRIDGFYDGVLSDQSKLKRVKITDAEMEKFGLTERSIVINRVNSKEYLGKCGFAQHIVESTVFESNMMNFKVDELKLNPRFLVQQLQMPNIKMQIKTCSKDAVNQSSINQKDVKLFEIIVPTIDLQNRYESVCKRFLASKSNYDDSSSMNGDLFNAFSQKAFAGEL
jgi:type I restriction enzyme S subunit